MHTKLKVVFLFCLIGLLNFSCNKDNVEPVNNEDSSQTIMDMGGFSCEWDGTKFEMIVSQFNTITNGVGSDGEIDSSVSPVSSKKIYSSYIHNEENDDFFSISIGELEYSGSVYPDFSYFKSLFTEGDIEYSAEAKDGVELNLYLEGVSWNTSKGTADQSGSTFTITKLTEGIVWD